MRKLLVGRMRNRTCVDCPFASMDSLSVPVPMEEHITMYERIADLQRNGHHEVQSMPSRIHYHDVMQCDAVICIDIECKIPKRGKPKGSELAVVGLPKKKKAAERHVAFLKQHPKDQERGIF